MEDERVEKVVVIKSEAQSGRTAEQVIPADTHDGDRIQNDHRDPKLQRLTQPPQETIVAITGN